jgi:fatty-acyl-CoA synthase
MTEMSPLGTVSRVRSEIPPDAALAERARQGQVQPLVSLRVVDEAGAELPWDAESAGEVQASGPWIADAYFDNEAPSGRLDSDAFVTDAAGRRWLRTGDVGHISPLGQLELVDRAKDLIKSGGEWISSVRLEQIIDNHPAVAASAVIAIPDPKWDERPLAIVELQPGAEADPASVLELLRGAVASWQVPDEVRFVDRLPRNSLGKLDKQALRERFVPPHPDNE